MKRSILTLSALAILGAVTVPALAEKPYGNNDHQYNLRTAEGVKKLFRDNDEQK